MTTLMKDSGIDWIGKIPEGWKVKRLKDMISNLGGGNYGFDIETLDKDLVLSKCFSISDFKNGNLNSKNLNEIKMDRVYEKNNTIKKGTLLIEKCGGTKANPVGRIIIVEDNVSAYYTNFVQGVKVNKFMNSKYLHYQLQTSYNLRLHMNNVKQTTGIQNFNFIKFASEIIFLNPPLETQKKIAEYLDVEVSKLDKQVSLLERKYALLGDYKDALIFETVTQGINKNVAMKDSGIDWIGEIPEEWKVKRLKDVLSFPKLSKAKENSPNYLEIGDVNINTNDYDISNKEKLSVDNAKQAKKGMLVISTVRPARGGITIIKEDCPISSAFCVVNIKGNKYWYYLIKNKLFLNQLSNLNTGVTYPTCKDKDIYNQSSCVPPLETQQKIADYLDVEVEKLDKQRELIKRKVELLKEYKEALIFEVVTGKKEVK